MHVPEISRLTHRIAASVNMAIVVNSLKSNGLFNQLTTIALFTLAVVQWVNRDISRTYMYQGGVAGADLGGWIGLLATPLLEKHKKIEKDCEYCGQVPHSGVTVFI